MEETRMYKRLVTDPTYGLKFLLLKMIASEEVPTLYGKPFRFKGGRVYTLKRPTYRFSSL